MKNIATALTYLPLSFITVVIKCIHTSFKTKITTLMLKTNKAKQKN